MNVAQKMNDGGPDASRMTGMHRAETWKIAGYNGSLEDHNTCQQHGHIPRAQHALGSREKSEASRGRDSEHRECCESGGGTLAIAWGGLGGKVRVLVDVGDGAHGGW
jgi:hypothetical protein